MLLDFSVTDEEERQGGGRVCPDLSIGADIEEGNEIAADLEIRYGTGNWHGYRSEHLLKQGIVVVPCCRIWQMR
jgi:hypothetical protein